MRAGRICRNMTTKRMPEALKADVAAAQTTFDEFFNRARQAYARAVEINAGALRRRFRIADADLEFRLAHPALSGLFCDALAHNEIVPIGDPDFTFHIWDESSSGIAPPPACWDWAKLYGHGEITSLIDHERYLQIFNDLTIMSAAYRPSREAVIWVPSIRHAAERERGAPLVTLINWWASEYGYFNIHAAAVGRPDGGVLILGKSGAGKSHTAIACLESDLLYVADDHCLVSAKDGPVCASIYSTAKLHLYDLYRFPILQKHERESIRTQEGKAIFFLSEIAPDRLSPGFPIRAVVLPQPSGRRDTVILPIAASAAFLLLGPYNVCRSPSVGRTAFASFASMIRSIPCFKLEAGIDLLQIPITITSLLDALRG